MGRRDVDAGSSRMGPQDWPDWILGPPSAGVHTDDPARQTVTMAAFHQWQVDRRDWFTAHGIVPGFREAERERRRRFPRVDPP